MNLIQIETSLDRKTNGVKINVKLSDELKELIRKDSGTGRKVKNVKSIFFEENEKIIESRVKDSPNIKNNNLSHGIIYNVKLLKEGECNFFVLLETKELDLLISNISKTAYEIYNKYSSKREYVFRFKQD
jgi:hypothetical protein